MAEAKVGIVEVVVLVVSLKAITSEFREGRGSSEVAIVEEASVVIVVVLVTVDETGFAWITC